MRRCLRSCILHNFASKRGFDYHRSTEAHSAIGDLQTCMHRHTSPRRALQEPRKHRLLPASQVSSQVGVESTYSEHGMIRPRMSLHPIFFREEQWHHQEAYVLTAPLLTGMIFAADGAREVKARIVAIVAEGQLSNLGRDIEVTSEAVMEHMAQRLSFVDPGFDMEVYTDKQLQARSLNTLTCLSCAPSSGHVCLLRAHFLFRCMAGWMCRHKNDIGFTSAWAASSKSLLL